MSKPIRIDLESNYESSDFSSTNSSITYSPLSYSPYSQYSSSPDNRSSSNNTEYYSEFSILNIPEAHATMLTGRNRVIIPPSNINLVETNSINSNITNSTTSSSISDVYYRLISKHKIYYTYIYFLLIWILFLVNVSKHKNNGYNEYNDLIYMKITNYPKCKYIKYEIWRLITNQFIHSNTGHIIGNSIVFLPSSIIIEHIYGFKYMILQSLISSILATIAKANLNPFVILLGSSSIVFSIIGSFFPIIIFNYDILGTLSLFHVISIPIFVIFFEIISYFFFKSESTSYISHWVGFISGFLLSSQFIKIVNKKNWKIFLKGILFSILLLFTSILLFYYINYDSEIIYTDTFEKTKLNTCCSLYFYNERNNITNNFICV